MGVVSGVVMAYEFGTNWGGFSSFAGPVTGPLLTYEVMTAFFLEAGFLGIMLFRLEQGRPEGALRRDADGHHRHAHLDLLDSRVQ